MENESWQVLVIKDQDGLFYATVGDIRSALEESCADIPLSKWDNITLEEIKLLLPKEVLQQVKHYAKRVNINQYSSSLDWVLMSRDNYLKDMDEGVFISKSDKEKIQRAIDLALSYGQIDGDHHKLWTIDQIVRILSGSKKEYEKTIEKYENPQGLDRNSPDFEIEYSWDTGCPP